jgi:hypothetical protein
VDGEMLTQVLLQAISEKDQIRGWQQPETGTMFLGNSN